MCEEEGAGKGNKVTKGVWVCSVDDGVELLHSHSSVDDAEVCIVVMWR